MRLPITRSSITALYSAFDPPLLLPAARFVLPATTAPCPLAVLTHARGPHRIGDPLAGVAIVEAGEPEVDHGLHARASVHERRAPYTLGLVQQRGIVERTFGIAVG